MMPGPLRLIRVSTSGLAAVGSLAGIVVAVGRNIGWADLPLAVAGFAVVFLAVAGGNALNDYLDVEVDKVNRPDRPLPRGELSLGSARLIATVLMAGSLAVATLLPLLAFLIVVVAILVQLTYEFVAKKRGALGNVLIAAQTGLLFVFGGSIVGDLTPVLLFSALAFLAILGREIAKDISDVAGDTDRSTIPRVQGLPFARRLAAGFVLGAVALSPVPFLATGLVGPSYLVIVAVADAIFIYATAKLLRGEPRTPESVMKYAMFLALLAFIIGRLL
jgi:geranylgeranylglycerol-phosphate geranylgeranyltransferase